jgi:hypothetical protein
MSYLSVVPLNLLSLWFSKTKILATDYHSENPILRIAMNNSDNHFIEASRLLKKCIKLDLQLPVLIIIILSVPDSAPNTSPGRPSS